MSDAEVQARGVTEAFRIAILGAGSWGTALAALGVRDSRPTVATT